MRSGEAAANSAMNVSKVTNTSLFATRSARRRLTDEQITLCYNAAIDHYERVMQTVKSRGLVHELREGFDVLREVRSGEERTA